MANGEIKKMIAYRLLQPQQPPRLQEVPKPSPQAGQLLIKVGGCGLCHTDVAIMGKNYDGLLLRYAHERFPVARLTANRFVMEEARNTRDFH